MMSRYLLKAEWFIGTRRSTEMTSRFYRFAPFSLFLALLTTSLVMSGCGGGGGGGGNNQRVLRGLNGVRSLSSENQRIGAQLNNLGQLEKTVRDYTATPINPRSNGRPTTPQESLFNIANALSDPELTQQLRDRYPNALSLDDFGVTIDFDNVPAEVDWTLSGIYDFDNQGVVSRQALPKLFRGKVRVQKVSETSEAKQVEVTCPEEKPLEVTPAVPGGAKLKLLGGLKAQIPKASQPNQTAQAQIDYEALKIEDRSQVNREDRKGDVLILGEDGKNESSAIVLKVAPDETDSVSSFDIEGMDWDDCSVTWVDDDLLTYMAGNLIEGYLTWELESSGFWYIYEEVDTVDCAGFYGADWSLNPLPRSRRQAELLIPLEFIWDDTLSGCGAIDDYQLAFSIDGVNYLVDALEESEFIDWCEETDADMDIYLAALLNLPPGADLADTVLTAEAWATGLPQFGYYMYLLHTTFANPASGVSIEGDYPSNYTATLTNFAFGEATLSGKLTAQFSQASNQLELSVTFEDFYFDDTKLNGTLNMTYDEGTGQLSIALSQFAWDIPDESQGNVPDGTLTSLLEFDNNGELVEVRTTEFGMRMNVKNLWITPAQTYNVELSATQPLVWPISQCFYSVEGILSVRGTVSGQSIQMSVDFGSDGECNKVIVSSGGRSAKYNLEEGVFEELTRLRGKTRSHSPPRPHSMRFWLNRSARN